MTTNSTMTDGLPVLSLAMLPRLVPVLTAIRNSKGRIMPLHILGAPGVGKTMVVDMMTRILALMNPGTPYGMVVMNPPILAPTDVPGVMLFDTDSQGRRNATYTRPVIFRVSKVFFCPADPTDSDPADESESMEQAMARRAARLQVVSNPMTYQETPNGVVASPLYAGDMMRDASGTVWGYVRDGIMLLDEFMQAPTDTQASLAPLLDEGRAGIHHLPTGWMVMAASNRAKDQSGTKKHLAFLTNRVCAVEVSSSLHGRGGLKDYLMGLTRPDVPPHDLLLPGYDSFEPRESSRSPLVRRPVSEVILSYAESNEGTLFEGVPSDPSLPFLTPRSLELASAIFDALMRDEDGGVLDASYDGSLGGTIEERRSAFLALAGGVIGRANAATLLGVADLWGQLPTVQEIVAGYKNNKPVPVPERMDAQLLMAYRIAGHMTMKNADACMAYLSRLRPAFYHNAVVAACTRRFDPAKPDIPPGLALQSHPAVLRYSEKYPDEYLQVITLASARRK